MLDGVVPMDAPVPVDANPSSAVEVADTSLQSASYGKTFGPTWDSGDRGTGLADPGARGTRYSHDGSTPAKGVTATMDNGVVTITGTPGNDQVLVTQTGDTLTVSSGSASWSFRAVTRIVAFMGEGDDVVRVDRTVTVPTELHGQGGNDTLIGGAGYNILDGGLGNDSLIGGPGGNTLDGGEGNDTLVTIGSSGKNIAMGGAGKDSFWVGPRHTTDADATEVARGYLHTVRQFYQPWADSPTSPDYVRLTLDGPSLRDPTPTNNSYGYRSYAAYPLFAEEPDYADIKQGRIGNCYFLVTLGSFATAEPESIRNAIVNLGDGTYAVRFYRGGQEIYVRVDASLPTCGNSPAYASMGPHKELWVPLLEKAWACYRNSSPSYTSTTTGWMNEVYAAMTGRSCRSYYVANMSGANIYRTAFDLLSSGYALTIGTKASPPSPIQSNHAYIIVGASTDNQGTQWVTFYNPFGYDGGTWDSNPGDGLIRMKASQIPDYFTTMISIDPM